MGFAPRDFISSFCHAPGFFLFVTGSPAPAPSQPSYCLLNVTRQVSIHWRVSDSTLVISGGSFVIVVGLGVSPRLSVGPLRVLVRYWTWMTALRTATRLEIVTNIYSRRGQGPRARAPPHGERAITAPRPHPQASASIASSRLSSLLPGTSLAPGRGPRQRAWAAPCGDALRLSACTVGLRHGHTKKRYDLRLTSSASVRS